MKKLALLCAASTAMFMTGTATADAAVNFTTDTTLFTMLGDEIGSQFDKITLQGVSGIFTGAGTYTLNHVLFEVDVNATTVHDVSGFFANTGTSDLGPFSYNVPYFLHIDSSDTITLGGNSITSNGYIFTINSLVLNSGVGSAEGDLTFTAVAVPEPASWALMLAGFGLAGAALRRRPSVKITYA
jgi:PEP-CTERM motif